MKYIKKLFDFFKEVKSEMGRVAWPDIKTVMSGTWGVILFSAIVVIFIAFFDFIFSRLIGVILQ
jgi:preprotein translocase SecE subunit